METLTPYALFANQADGSGAGAEGRFLVLVAAAFALLFALGQIRRSVAPLESVLRSLGAAALAAALIVVAFILLVASVVLSA
ncbi:hypothetical protein GCM10022251_60770 [Phytohabitans flavus]|uniref:Uncharacterized protein n=1 Tax=Phytohabitans flavus TaxID=1076124 RepID=A0A6F8Y4C5_9ACTN|nr:hypothetical protein [Phytohabitans flavus]BCB80966.1 hypothetical protein Pflav_073760 [Phytohabitans flavus]